MSTKEELTVEQLVPWDYEGQQVRQATDQHGRPWFSLIDICRSIGVRNPHQASARLDDDEITDMKLPDGSTTVRVISEPGAYHLLLTSRTPDAARMRHWLTHEVLPAINARGAYLTSKMRTEVTSSQASIDRRADAALYEISQAHIIALKQPDARGCQILAQHLVDAALHLAKARQEQGPLLSLIDRPMTQLGAGVADTIRSPEIRKAIGAPTLEQVRAQALAAYAEPVDNN